MMAIRVICTVIVLGLWTVLDRILTTGQTLVTGQVAGSQFDNSDNAYVQTVATFSLASWAVTIAGVIAFLLIVALWYGPIKKWWAALSILALFALVPMHAKAYYDKQDFAEAYFILPNESAFFIPDVGANRDSQAQFGSEDYLKQNKVPAKRFLIPHAKFSGSGSLWADYFVPTGRLIIVDRTPYNREWVAQSSRGTSTKDESFPCQSKEGLNITVGIAIGATVLEENAAKFLYRFGVKPPVGDRNRPEVIFTSVFYGRNLQEVMDSTIRSKIQTLVCNEIAKKTLDENNTQMAATMAAIETATNAYANGVGITIEYIGWGDTFTFDKNIQDVVNRVYIASHEAEIASKMAPHTGTLQALATAEATRTVANKWDGKVPSTISTFWMGLGDLASKLFGGTGK